MRHVAKAVLVAAVVVVIPSLAHTQSLGPGGTV
jgi:hypothetical protein